MPPRLPITPAVEGSQAWIAALRGPATPAREDAPARLHPQLLRATRFDDLAVHAADDALMSILRTLDDFRGASRFTTWASKFAVHEAGVTSRRSAAQARERLGGRA